MQLIQREIRKKIKVQYTVHPVHALLTLDNTFLIVYSSGVYDKDHTCMSALICNGLSYFICTCNCEGITFTSILYPQCTHFCVIFIINIYNCTHHVILFI